MLQVKMSNIYDFISEIIIRICYSFLPAEMRDREAIVSIFYLMNPIHSGP